MIKCEKVVKDAAGNITEVHCSYDRHPRRHTPDGRKIKGTIHWSRPATLFARAPLTLFTKRDPDDIEEGTFRRT